MSRRSQSDRRVFRRSPLLASGKWPYLFEAKTHLVIRSQRMRSFFLLFFFFCSKSVNFLPILLSTFSCPFVMTKRIYVWIHSLSYRPSRTQLPRARSRHEMQLVGAWAQSVRRPHTQCGTSAGSAPEMRASVQFAP